MGNYFSKRLAQVAGIDTFHYLLRCYTKEATNFWRNIEIR